MEIVLSIAFIVFLIWIWNKDKWASNNRVSPPETTHDWSKANADIVLKGEDYYHKQNLAGKYDIPNKK